MVPFELLIKTAALQPRPSQESPAAVPPAIDADRAARLLRNLLSSLGLFPELSDAEANEALNGFLKGDQSPFQNIAKRRAARGGGNLAPEDVEETALFCALLAAREQWTRFSRAVAAAPAAPFNLCPVCGGIGRMEIIAGEDGRRSLVCPACDALWRIPRVGCPHCGEQDGSRLEVLSAAEEPGRAMVHCRSCGRAWRRRDMGRQPYPEGMALADAFLPWAVEASLCSSSNILPVPLRVSAVADSLSLPNSAIAPLSLPAETDNKG